MGKCLNTVKYTESLHLSEYTDGFYLYDYTRGMNLAMYKKTQEDAFITALQYYQKRLSERENELANIKSKVLGFVEMFVVEVDYGSSTDMPDTVLEINI